MIKILIILIVGITILFVPDLCKTAKRADKNAHIILKNIKLTQNGQTFGIKYNTKKTSRNA
ncbi:hypothetical protein CLPUN_10840 [Clostridium puniceum]|uniref:Uncharacterized protein n=1 Tax=Clostridium puniceum TaxID=29367 RepID=A0A1S8TV05_9CLOT|nr:hypothetical protein [Clostridium puniceum]OOM81521.1 hypothetical protein CLPUN_10840 [Clostridium puniceum]